jgi:hypothetical protein
VQLKGGRKRDVWSENPSRKLDLVKRSIAYKRFQFVMRNLSFVGDRVDDGTLTFKVAPLLETFRRRCIDNWSMGPTATYDEMAVGMTGRGKKGLTQTFLNKPVSRGVRIEAICAAQGKGKGYTYNFLVSRDTSIADAWLRSFPHHDVLEGMSTSSRAYTAILWSTIIQEVNRERRRSSRWAFGIVMDNLFSQPSLFEWMARHGVWGLGTWRKNYEQNDWLLKQKVSAQIPGVFEKFVKFGLWEDAPTIRMMGAKICGNGGKKKGFFMLSTCPHAIGEQVRANAPFQGDATLFDLQNIYNMNKIGVDMHDQFRASYNFGTRYRKWTVTLFLWLVNAALVNAYICCRFMTEKPMSAIEFRESIARVLLTGSTQPEEQTPVMQRVSPVTVKQVLDVRLVGRHFPM